MLVRDKTKKVKEYKGRLTDASDALCPCCPCYSPHDCGYRLGSGKWLTLMDCITRHNNGCPVPKPEPTHVYKSERAYVCQRCGYRRSKEGLRMPDWAAS